MPKYQMLALSNPVAGREDEYNDWYSNTHLADVLKVPGLVAAQRFKASVGIGDYRYMALYEIDAKDPQAVMDEIITRFGNGTMTPTDTMDSNQYFSIYEAITERKTA